MEKATKLHYLLLQKIYFLMCIIILITAVLIWFIYKYCLKNRFIGDDDVKQGNMLKLFSKDAHINIVYFANLYSNPTHGVQLVKQQLQDIIDTGLVNISTVHIVLSMPRHRVPSVRERIYSLFYAHHRVLFHINNEDCDQYPGLQLVYSLSVVNKYFSSSYVLYFHSKGIAEYRGKRQYIEKALHKTVIQPWRKVLEIFESHPRIDKIGSSFSQKGCVWFNYWWARASYLAKLEPPFKTTNHDYYEEWLSYVLKDPYKNIILFNNKNCWALSVKDHKKWCHKKDAHRFLVQKNFTNK